MSLNESIVEDAALEWLGELGYAIGHGPQSGARRAVFTAAASRTSASSPTSSWPKCATEGAWAKIRVMVKRILKKHGYPPGLQDEAVKTVLAQAELLSAGWAEG